MKIDTVYILDEQEVVDLVIDYVRKREKTPASFDPWASFRRLENGDIEARVSTNKERV